MSLRPIKFTNEGAFRELLTSEEDYLAYKAGLHLSKMDINDLSAISTNTQAELVGSFENTFYTSGVGSVAGETISRTYNVTHTSDPSGSTHTTTFGSITNLPSVVYVGDTIQITISGTATSTGTGFAEIEYQLGVLGDEVGSVSVTATPTATNITGLQTTWEDFGTQALSGSYSTTFSFTVTTVGILNITLNATSTDPNNSIAGSFDDEDLPSIQIQAQTRPNTSSVVYQLYQNNDDVSAIDEQHPSIINPVYWDRTASPAGLKEMNDTELDTVIENLLRKIFSSDLPGQYRLAAEAPSEHWSEFIADVFFDTRGDNSQINYSIWVKSSSVVPTPVKIVAPVRMPLTNQFGGFRELSGPQLEYTFGEKMKRTIQTTGIGKYQLRSSEQGAPTDAGVWEARGNAVDTNLTYQETTAYLDIQRYGNDYVSSYDGIFTTDYLESYNTQVNPSAGYEEDYTGVSEERYTGNYTLGYTQNFTLEAIEIYSGAENYDNEYENSFTGEFEGNFHDDYVNVRLVPYATDFLRDYADLDYLREYVQIYESTYLTDYLIDYETNYIQDDYAGDYAKEYAGVVIEVYANLYEYDYNIDYTKSVPVDYSGDYTIDYDGGGPVNYEKDYEIGSYDAYTQDLSNYTNEYELTREVPYEGGYTEDVPEGYIDYTDVPYEEEQYTGFYTSNLYDGSVVNNYSVYQDYHAGDFQGVYDGSYTGTFAGEYEEEYQRLLGYETTYERSVREVLSPESGLAYTGVGVGGVTTNQYSGGYAEDYSTSSETSYAGAMDYPNGTHYYRIRRITEPGTGIDYYEHKVVWNNVVVYDSAPNAGGGASPAPKTGSDGAIYTGGVQTSSAGASEYTYFLVTRTANTDYVNTYSSQIDVGPLTVNSYRYEAEDQYTADHNAYYNNTSTSGYNPNSPDAELSNASGGAYFWEIFNRWSSGSNSTFQGRQHNLYWDGKLVYQYLQSASGNVDGSGGLQAGIIQAPAILTPPDGVPNADGVLPSYFIPAQSDAKIIDSYSTSAGGGIGSLTTDIAIRCAISKSYGTGTQEYTQADYTTTYIEAYDRTYIGDYLHQSEVIRAGGYIAGDDGAPYSLNYILDENYQNIFEETYQGSGYFGDYVQSYEFDITTIYEGVVAGGTYVEDYISDYTDTVRVENYSGLADGTEPSFPIDYEVDIGANTYTADFESYIPQLYEGDYENEYEGSNFIPYSTEYAGGYETDYEGNYESGYENIYSNYESPYVGNYIKSYETPYETGYSTDYSINYVTDYTLVEYAADYETTFQGNYTSIYTHDYLDDFEGTFTKEFTSTYTHEVVRLGDLVVTDYEGVYEKDFLSVYISENDENYTGVVDIIEADYSVGYSTDYDGTFEKSYSKTFLNIDGELGDGSGSDLLVPSGSDRLVTSDSLIFRVVPANTGVEGSYISDDAQLTSTPIILETYTLYARVA